MPKNHAVLSAISDVCYNISSEREERKTFMVKKNKKNKKAGAKKTPVPDTQAPESGKDALTGIFSFSETETPEGFRPVSMIQALAEYARPIMAFSEGKNDVENLQKSLDIARNLWNYGIKEEKGNKDEKLRAEIIRMIKTLSGLNDNESSDFFNKMIARRTYLFPSEVQGDNPMITVMRKEFLQVIPDPESVRVNLPQAPVPPDDKDRAMVKALNKMDRYILENTEYDEWESHYFSIKEDCCRGFRKWLADKGVSRYSDDFPFCLETFFNFVYQQSHKEPVILKNIPPAYIESFFMDYLLRKVVAEPGEYIQWIPAIKAFYTFISEKGYIADPDPVIRVIEKTEPHFVRLLKKRFG